MDTRTLIFFCLLAASSCKKEEAAPPLVPPPAVQPQSPAASILPVAKKPVDSLSYGLADVKGLKPTMSYEEANRTHNIAQFLAWRAQDPKKYMGIAWNGDLVQAMFVIDYNGPSYKFESKECYAYPLSAISEPKKINRSILHYAISKKCHIDINLTLKNLSKLMQAYDIYKSGANSPLSDIISCRWGIPNEEDRHWIHCLIQNGAKINTIYSRESSNIDDKYFWKNPGVSREFSHASYWGTILDMVIGRCCSDKTGIGLSDPLIQQLRDYGCVTCEEAIKSPSLQQMTAKPEAITKYHELGKIEKVWEDPKVIEEWHAKYRKDLQDLKDSQ